MELQFSLYHSPFASRSDLLASVILSVTALISERGVTHAIGTEDPCVSRNVHAKFHLDRLCGSSTKSFMALTQTETPLYLYGGLFCSVLCIVG